MMIYCRVNCSSSGAANFDQFEDEEMKRWGWLVDTGKQPETTFSLIEMRKLCKGQKNGNVFHCCSVFSIPAVIAFLAVAAELINESVEIGNCRNIDSNSSSSSSRTRVCSRGHRRLKIGAHFSSIFLLLLRLLFLQSPSNVVLWPLNNTKDTLLTQFLLSQKVVVALSNYH